MNGMKFYLAQRKRVIFNSSALWKIFKGAVVFANAREGLWVCRDLVPKRTCRNNCVVQAGISQHGHTNFFGILQNMAMPTFWAFQMVAQYFCFSLKPVLARA